MTGANFVLKNRFLVARISASKGSLTHLSSDGRGAGLLIPTRLRYLDLEAKDWHSNEKTDTVKKIEVRTVTPSDAMVTCVHRSEHLEITSRYELKDDSPLLSATICVRGLGSKTRLGHLALPRIEFTAGFNDTFEDEKDLYFDGAELGQGMELPCWRVFFRKDNCSGLILATRNKREMARFNLLANAIDLEPNGHFNYTTMPVSGRDPLIPAKGVVFEVRFEFGPWRKSQHQHILSRAGLHRSARHGSPAPKGKPKPKLRGRVFHVLDFAGRSSFRSVYSPHKWMLAKLPWAQSGNALVAGSGVHPPALRLNPKLKGVHRIFVGVGNGVGVTLRLSGDPESTIRMAPHQNADEGTAPPFTLFLSGRHRPQEVCYGVSQMDGRSVRIERFPNTFGTTVLDYIRFEKLTPSQVRRWGKQEAAKPHIELSGFNDVPDISPLTDVVNPDPAAYRANIWEHARCGFKRIYWRIDGQCSDYQSKVNTMRYISAKVHGVFSPTAKAYGRVLQKVDMLRIAVDAAKKYEVELYGWMRFNNYTGNVQSDFYKQNPQFWEEWEHGHRGGKLCLAIPEVRRHKIDILVEAASYGLQGLNLGFLRHPPILMFHPALVKSYRQKYGVLPPRDPKRPDQRFINTLPPADWDHTRWYQHRADFMTLFGQELRTALKAKRLGHVKISIWVRPNHCLFDGIDLPAWLEQGLCDEVVCNGMIGPERCYAERFDPKICGLRPEWKKMVQAKVPLVRCLAYYQISRWRQHLPQVLAEGYDGLCTYESDWAVLDTDYIDVFKSLRASRR